jgi:hypothetical protein
MVKKIKDTDNSNDFDLDDQTYEKGKEGDVTIEPTKLVLPEEDPDEVPKSYIPEGFKSQEDYLQDMRETYELDLEADEDNRRAALEDKRFVAGEQWDPQVLQQRAGLPCLVLNTIPQFTAQLVGDWRENRNGVKVLPADVDDKNIAAIRADLIRSIETRNRSDRVYDSAFESMVQCGDGSFRVGVQYTSDDAFDQDIVLQPIDDALSVVWDRLSIDPTGRDATHCFVDDRLPKKEFEKRWKDATPSTLNPKEKGLMIAKGWIDSSSVRVTEHWRMIERKRLLGLFEDGSVHVLEGKELDKLYQDHGKPVKTRLAPCSYAQMHLVTGFKILAGPYEWKLSRLPIIRMSGRVVTVGDRRVRFGLVRYMKDAARLRNFWRSVAAEQLGYAPKAQWIAPESAVEGREEQFRKAHLSRDPLLVYNDDATEAPQRVEPPQIQQALLNEAQINTQDMKDITGIHDASLGIQSNETSGRAIMARQREGDVASLTYYDNGNAAILEAGDVMNQLISQIYDGTRIVRIVGEDESSKLVAINDPNDPGSPNLAIGKYDVALTTGASYTTRRVEAAEAMMEAIQVYPQLMQIAGDLVVKAQDWPGAEDLAERLQRTIPPQLLSDKEKQEMGEQGPDMQAIMQQQQQVQQQLQTAVQQLAKLEQENHTLKVKADIEAKKLEIEEYKAETDRLTAYANIAKADAELSFKQLEREADDELERQEQELDHAHTTVDQALQFHSQLSDQDMQQQQMDMQQEQQQRDLQDRDTLNQLRIEQLSRKLNPGTD